MNLPERLKEARKAAGLTQEDVAKRLGISKSTYCCYETGRHSPDPNALVILCKAFNVSADYLLGIEKGSRQYGRSLFPKD